ncbi:related to C-8,7 sterol isomerase [Cephalotrichum gorgonifer]|uniref:Related to C-8,7 sterol isomerase n=1 Tax=Cephalotrichum gorgonifer TaxID=2041049 RepID=A0AAE8MZW0_9PEZI|nr:related to C-8,7 sterol isomerase [Cephalotrichum gorgonifer]
MEEFHPNHPYSPANALIPHYAENDRPLALVVGSLGVMLATVGLGSAGLAARVNPRLGVDERWIVGWYSICGFLHCFFEGYFVLNHATLASQQTLFAQLWKEYALSDSRYLTSDPFMISVETITVLVWGPLCFFAALCIVRRSSLRHPVQMMVCMGHLYGVVLYYSTSMAEQYYRGVAHSRPEVLYFWVYYFGFNLPWVIVPTFLLVRSIRAMRLAFMTLGSIQGVVCDLQERLHDIKKRSSDEDCGLETKGEEKSRNTEREREEDEDTGDDDTEEEDADTESDE